MNMNTTNNQTETRPELSNQALAENGRNLPAIGQVHQRNTNGVSSQIPLQRVGGTNSRIVQPEQPILLLALSAITQDKRIMVRAKLNPQTIEEYSQRMQAGDKFPPLVIFQYGGEYVLVDGFHRYEAARQAGKDPFPIVVYQRSRKDAIKFALHANSNHGLPRSNADKRLVVKLALSEFPGLSSRTIAGHCSMSHTFVDKVRAQLATVASCRSRMGKDGKLRQRPQERQADSAAAQRHKESIAETGPVDSSGPADEARAPEPGDAAAFDAAAEWIRIQDFLNEEVRVWPHDHRGNLANRLREYANALRIPTPNGGDRPARST